jgi:AcrR family transcriptional regulator
MATSQKLKWLEEGAVNPLDESPALYEAALTAFAAHSFRDASLNDILKAANMNKGSFYYRFRDKMELYLSLLYRVGTEKIRLFQEQDVSHTSSGFFDEFRNMALIGLKLAKKDPRFVVFSRKILQEDAEVRERNHCVLWRHARGCAGEHGGARESRRRVPRGFANRDRGVRHRNAAQPHG